MYIILKYVKICKYEIFFWNYNITCFKKENFRNTCLNRNAERYEKFEIFLNSDGKFHYHVCNTFSFFAKFK